jgi:hypothetical protein
MSITWKTTSLALVLCALAVAASFHVLQNADENIPTASLVRHTGVVDAKTIAVQKASIIAAAGQNAVAYINAARGQLQTDDLAGAKRFAAQASAILEQIRNALHPDRDNRKAGEALRVPLWAQVSLKEEGATPAALESRLEEATAYAIQGEHDKVVEGLATSGVGVVYSYIDMPLDATLGRLDAARAAMENGAAAKALALLSAATDGLTSETLEIGTTAEGQTTAPDDA